MRDSIHFFADGKPIQEGNIKKFKNHRTGKQVYVHAENMKTKGGEINRLNKWREWVGWCARAKCCGQDPWTGPIQLTARFLMPRPKSMPKSKNPPHIKKPDLDKLVRAIKDAMAGIVYHDDNLVTGIDAKKAYAEHGKDTGVSIRIDFLDG